MRFSSASPALHRAPGPFALRSLVPDSGRVRSETREGPGRSQCRPQGVRTRRAATCSTKPGVCASAGYSREDPVVPSVWHTAGSPEVRVPPSPSAHSPSRNPRLAPLGLFARGDLLPCLPAPAPTLALAVRTHTTPSPSARTAPQNTCCEDAENEESLADHGTLVLGAEPGAGGGRVCQD